MAQDQLKTGTTTVAIRCRDGIILGADRRATAGYVVSKREKKVVLVNDWIAITTAGMVSDIQLLGRLLKAELKLKDIQTNRPSAVKEAANLLAGLVYYNIRKMSMVPGITSFIMGGRDSEGFHAYEIGLDGSVIDVEDYTSVGSGEVFSIGVFETLYKKDLTVEEGVKLALKGLNASLQRDPNSGNGVDVLAITDKGAQFVVEREVNPKIEV
jgi:proteasome beta subunit